MSGLLIDTSLDAAKLALDGLSLRQQVISRNIANVDTPGYRAQSVNFESAVQNALHRGTSLALRNTHDAHLAADSSSVGFTSAMRNGGSVRADQNDVDIDVELTEMSETGIWYQAVSQSVSKKLALLKSITAAS